MIVNMQEEQQGLYQIVVKDGGCEVRNTVEVKLQGLYSLDRFPLRSPKTVSITV